MRRHVTLALVALLTLSLVAPIAAAGTGLEYGDERAELEIYQPPWIDDEPTVDRSANRTVYEVRGDVFEVRLANVDHDHVERMIVADGSASVEYDEERDLWHVDPDGEGTVTLQWVAEEPVFDESGNVAETETVRYAASLRVSDSEWVHLRESEYEQTRQDAANWSAVESEANSIAPDRSVDSVLSTGLAAARFLDNPTAALTADVQGVLIMMTMRPGGLLILGTFLALIALTAATGFRWRHRFEKQLGEHDRVAQEMREAWLNKSRTILQQYDWPDILPDRFAQWTHDKLGPNVWYGLKEYRMIRSSLHTKGLLLQLMSQIGYIGVVHYDAQGNVSKARALTHSEYEDEYGGIDIGSDDDNGDGDGPPDVIDVDGTATDGGILETEEIEILSFEDLRMDHEVHREIIRAIPAEDLDESVFLPSVDLDLSRVSLPIDPNSIEDSELVRSFEPAIPGDFEDYDQYARTLARMLELAVNHPHYTDSDGEVRSEMDLLSFLAELDSVMADKAEFSSADIERKILYLVADELDANDHVESTLEDAYQYGVGRTDEQSADVIGPDDVDLGPSKRGEGV